MQRTHHQVAKRAVLVALLALTATGVAQAFPAAPLPPQAGPVEIGVGLGGIDGDNCYLVLRHLAGSKLGSDHVVKECD